MVVLPTPDAGEPKDDPDLPELMTLTEEAKDKTSRYSNLGIGFGVAAGLFAAGTVVLVAMDYYSVESNTVDVSLLPGTVEVRF